MRSRLERRLERIAPNGRAMILAYDQGVEHGPRDFAENSYSVNPSYIINVAAYGGFTGLVLHAGIAEKFRDEIRKSGVPLILKLNGKTELYTEEDPYSPQLYWESAREAVKGALALGATAVGYTVYSGSRYESEMNVQFSRLAREAHRRGVPVIGWMYPRGEFLKGLGSKTSELASQETPLVAVDETAAIVSYAARMGMELGADIVKVKYTGSVKTFLKVVQAAWPTKVVMSGGPKTSTDEAFVDAVRNVLNAGGIGIAVGRNVWQRKDPLNVASKIRNVIFK